MEQKDQETIRHISDTLDEILAFLKKPENKVMKVLEIGATITGFLAILGIIQIVRDWIIGG
jgi:hypothetical protein